MRTLSLACLAALALAVLAGPAGAQPGFDGRITLTDEGFAPADAVVATGSVIVWTNASSSPASVTGAGATTFDSSPACSMDTPADCLQPGQTFEATLDAPGTVVYRDKVSGRIGSLSVVAPGQEGIEGPVDGRLAAQAEPAPQPTPEPAPVEETLTPEQQADTADATEETGHPRTGGGAVAAVAGLVLLGAAAALRRTLARA